MLSFVIQTMVQHLEMEAEQKLEDAMELIAQKDARIAELEALVRNLSGGTMGTMPSSVQHNLLQSQDRHSQASEQDLNARVEFTATEEQLNQEVRGNQAPTLAKINQIRDQGAALHNNDSNEGEDDFWYQTGDDNMLK